MNKLQMRFDGISIHLELAALNLGFLLSFELWILNLRPNGRVAP
jgi:hypothetical protein